jgi:cell division septation protein DedD
MRTQELTLPSAIIVLIALTIAVGAMVAAALALSVGQPSQPSPALATHSTDAKQTAGDASVDPDEICKEGITGEWHFVINQVDVQGNAPGSIEVTFDDGHSHTVNLDPGTGSPVAHYTLTTHLTNTLLEATAVIYHGWDGQFVVSHTPCAPTPATTPTASVLAATPTPTPTATAVPAAVLPAVLPPTGGLAALAEDSSPPILLALIGIALIAGSAWVIWHDRRLNNRGGSGS